MLIFHQTEKAHIIDLLNSGYILPASKTKKKSQNPYDVHLNKIFFSTMPHKKSLLKILYSYTFVFDSSILYNKIWYMNTNHSAGNIKNSTKYDKYENNINRHLQKLWKKSYEIYKSIGYEGISDSAFAVFQEIFFSGKLSLKFCKYLIVENNDSDIDNEIINIVKTKYPHIKLIKN